MVRSGTSHLYRGHDAFNVFKAITGIEYNNALVRLNQAICNSLNKTSVSGSSCRFGTDTHASCQCGNSI